MHESNNTQLDCCADTQTTSSAATQLISYKSQKTDTKQNSYLSLLKVS